MSKVDVILTSFNRPRMVTQAVESVLQQSYKNFLLWAMDDNSIPEVQEILQVFAKKDKRIILKISDVKQEDRKKTCRYAVLINQALKLGSSPYISYITDDTEYLPDRLQKMVEFMDKNPAASVCYGNQKMLNLINNTVSYRSYNKVITRAFNVLDHNSILHRRSILLKTGYWSESAAHWPCSDAIFWDQIMNAGFLFYPVNAITEIYKVHSKSIISCWGSKSEFIDGIRE